MKRPKAFDPVAIVTEFQEGESHYNKGDNKTFNDKSNNDNNQNNSNWFDELMANDLFRIGLSTIIASTIYFVVVDFLPDAAYWLKHSVALGLSLLFLAFIDSALKKSGKDGIGTAVVVGIIFLFCFCIARHYLKEGSGAEDNIENVADEAKGAQGAQGAYSFNPILITDQNVFDLKAGEETLWFGFEEGIITNYSISSPSYDYDIVVSDGTRYKGGRDVVIPEKKHCYYKVIANSDQLVTVLVKK